MKKHILLLTATAAMLLSGCSGGKRELSPSRVKANGEQLVDKTVKITGKVLRVSYPVGRGLTLVDTSDNTTTLRVRTGGDVDLFSPKLMGKTITLTGEVKMRKITKEDVARMDSVIAFSDSLFARLDSMRANSSTDSMGVPMPTRHPMWHKGPRREAGDSMKKECRGEFMKRGPIPPHKAKFMKEKQQEIKQWFEANPGKEYYPEVYIEAIKLTPESRVLNKLTPEDSVRLQRHHAFDKERRPRHHHRDGHFKPGHRHPHGQHAPHGQQPDGNQTEQNN